MNRFLLPDVLNEDSQSPIRVFVNPDEKERRLRVDTYGIDENTLSSALDPDEVARPVPPFFDFFRNVSWPTPVII